MNPIKEFNHSLNQSLHIKQQKNGLKEQVDLLLKSTCKKLRKNENILILGAGKMNDFSMRFLLDSFEHITLSDIDTNTVQKSLDELPIKKKDLKRITIKEVEYTGFGVSEFFDDFKQRIVNARDFDKIDQIINHKLGEIKSYEFLKDEYGKYDLVYVSPIYTQLIYHQVLRECSFLRLSGYPEHLLKYIENIMLEEMISIIDRFNENVIKLINNDGMLFVLSDVFQLDVGSDFEIRVSNGIRSKIVMDEIYEGYKEKYGMGLGDYGLYNLDQLMITDLSRWMIWSFDEKTKFAVKLKIYKRLNI